MLSSLNYIVSNLHPQGVTQASRKRESHTESTHPQGCKGRDHNHTWRITFTKCGEDIPGKGEITVTRGESTSTRCGVTSLERERSKTHVESLHPQGADADVPRKGELKVTRGEPGPVVVGCARSCIVSRKRPTASRGRTYALSAEVAQARERSGEAREAPAQTAEGPGLRGWRGIPDGGCKLTWGRAWCPRRRLMRLWPRRTWRQYSGPSIGFMSFDNAWKWNRSQSFGPM
jgi:hypothetical protein